MSLDRTGSSRPWAADCTRTETHVGRGPCDSKAVFPPPDPVRTCGDDLRRPVQLGELAPQGRNGRRNWDTAMRSEILLSSVAALSMSLAIGCGGRIADESSSQTEGDDGGTAAVATGGGSGGSSSGGGGSETSSSSSSGGSASGGAGDLGNILGALGPDAGAGGLGAILGLLGGNGNGNGGLAGILGQLGAGDGGAFGGFTTCTASTDCAKGETCTQTPFGVGICGGANGQGAFGNLPTRDGGAGFGGFGNLGRGDAGAGFGGALGGLGAFGGGRGTPAH